MRLNLVQFYVGHDTAQNKERILSALSSAQRDDWFVFPEGALTGYFPEESGFLKDTDPAVVDRAVRDIEREVRRRRCHCLFGTATFAGGMWYNSVILQSYTGEQQVYSKVEVSNLDRRHFAPGRDISVYTVAGVRLGVQVCRELVFPEPWLKLRRQGAQIVFHINNAIKPYKVWEYVLITRALEHRLFVCSVNNAAPPQALTSYLVAPSGNLLLQAEEQVEQTLTYTI